MQKFLGLATASALALTAGAAYADRMNQLSDQRVRQAIALSVVRVFGTKSGVI